MTSGAAARASRFDADVSRRLLSFLESASAGTLATFDADGTLWGVDVGEAFLAHAGASGLLPKWPKGPAAWDEYQRRLATGDLRHAFDFCVTAFDGAPDVEVSAWAEAFVTPAWKQHIFPAMAGLVKSLLEAEAEVWIVSGSPAWCVIPGAAMLGIPETRVIAAIPALDSEGRVTAKMGAPLPTLETKVEAILRQAGRAPHLAAGNSEYDYPMLECSRVMSLLIDPPHSESWKKRPRGDAWLVQRWSLPGDTASETTRGGAGDGGKTP